MKMNVILLIFISICSISKQDLVCPPNSVIQSDSPWTSDPSDTEQILYGFLWRNKMGDTQYNDHWKGISYAKIEPDHSICYNTNYPDTIIYSKKTNDYGYITIDKSSTNIYNLYNEACCFEQDGCYIPIFLVPETFNKEYYMIFDIVNPTDFSQPFQFWATRRYYFEVISYPNPNDTSIEQIDVFDDEDKFPLTDPLIIEPHSVRKVTIPITIHSLEGNKELLTQIEGSKISANGKKSDRIFYIKQDGVLADRKIFHLELGQNLEVLFDNPNSALGIATFSMTYKRTNANTNYSGGSKCPFCIEHYSCFNLKCQECTDPACEKCENNKSICSKCPSTSTTWYELNLAQNGCTFDYPDLSKFSDITFVPNLNDKTGQEQGQVPPAIHWRVTMEFWTYINYPKKIMGKNLHIIYKDFMSITMTPSDDDGMNIICTPIEWMYPVDGITDPIKSYLDDKLGAFYMEDTQNNITSKWFYTRCGFNLDTNKAYINNQVEYNLMIPQIFTNQDNVPFQLKKFYKPDQYTSIKIQNFSGAATNIFLRNLNIYREYMPQKIETKFFNVHKIGSPIEFPQLLYSIPFDDVKGVGKSYSFTSYSFYKRIDNNNIVRSLNVLTRYNNSMSVVGADLMPPRNFYRLNLRDINTQAKDCEYFTTIGIQCGDNRSKCFDNNLAYACSNTGTADDPYYLDISTLSCNQKCPNGFHHPPDDTDFKQSLYCSKKCDSGLQICPWANEYYTDITTFTCPNGFFDLYYKCYRNDELIIDRNALFFSSAMNTHSIFIDLKHVYTSYLLEFWFFFDRRFNEDFDEKKLLGRLIFMTNAFYVFKCEHTSWPHTCVRVTKGGSVSSRDYPELLTWNHFVLSVDINNLVLASFGHMEYYLDGNANANMALNSITFCNEDYYSPILSNLCQQKKWVDAYYKNIKIWDISTTTRYALLASHQYEDVDTVMRKHLYTFNLNDITRNTIVDSIQGANGYVPFNSYTENVDNNNYILYEYNFYPNQFEGKYIQSYLKIKQRYQYAPGNCRTGCKICYGSGGGHCLSCLDGYALFTDKCHLIAENQNYYTYRNPATNMPNKLSLNIHKEAIDKFDHMTIFFFIKIYGFTRDIGTYPEDTKLIIFNEEQKFFLGYDQANESLYVSLKDKKIYEYKNFREKYFGHWVPFSISTFRETDQTFRRNMANCELSHYDLPYINGNLNDYTLPYLYFSEFSITNKWIGLLSDLKIYKDFIIHPWNLIKQDDDIIKKYLKYSIPLKSTSPGRTCLYQSDILTTTDAGFQVECVPDYNPHYDKCQGENSYVPFDQGEYNDQCEFEEPEEYYGYTYSCDNFDMKYYDYYPELSTMTVFYSDVGTRVRCRDNSYKNFNRFNNVLADKIQSPPVIFSIDFWFQSISANNQNYNPDINAKYGTKKINNFVSLDIIWDFHIKIKIENIKNNNDPYDNSFTYYASCTPMIDKSHPERDPPTHTIELGKESNLWYYVVCGVNAASGKMYLTKTNRVIDEIEFESSNSIPLGTVTLSIKDNSKKGYGFTHLRELRLWNCYDCSPGFRNFKCSANDISFSPALHCFDGLSSSTTYYDSIGKKTYDTPEVSDFNGYNIMITTNGVVYCDEKKDYNYYDESSGVCERQFDFARFQDFTFTIPSSRTGRYTLAFWFFVENSVLFNKGVNIVWDKHISLSILTESTDPSTIVGVCFPQAYRDKVIDKVGLEIFDVYNSAVNKAKYNFYGASSKWNYIICSLDHMRSLFYLNDLGEEELKGEILYGTTRNYKAFRYFDYNINSKLTIQHANLATTRVFLRSIRAFKDFIDYSLIDMKYLKIETSFSTYWPLTFYMDCNDVLDEKDIYQFSSHREIYLIYYINSENRNGGKKNTPRVQLVPVNYTTYPDIYALKLCEPGQSGGNKTKCTGNARTYGININGATDTFYYTSGGSYLNMETFKPESSCSGYTRLPDSIENKGYCQLKCDKNIFTCAESNDDLKDNNKYSAAFSCKPGYTRVYYECIEDSLIEGSAMYFNNYFSFNNLIFTAITPVKSYYLEVWIKLDPINYHDAITTIETYLLSPPHLIVQDNVDQKYKYGNLKISSGTYLYELSSMQMYEWNRIIIETQYDDTSTSYTIKIYMNYNFDEPEVQINDLDDSIYDMSWKGLGFCNQPYANCLIDGIIYNRKWGSAWYRNIRVWDQKRSSLELIQSCEVGYKELLKSQLYYFPFTIDYINNNRVEDRTDPAKKALTCNFWFDKKHYDYDMRENYSVKTFDYSLINPGTFINGLTEDGTNYQLTQCDMSCKRCYSSSNNNCYECQDGYALYGKTCKTITGYYFKTPCNNNTISTMTLKTTLVDPLFDISTQNSITITIWVKFFGVKLDIIDRQYYPLFYFYNTLSFFGFDSTNEAFVVNLSKDKTPANIITAFSVPIKKYIGQWTHIGLSIHRSETDANIFPHMFNLMLNREIILPYNGFDPREIPVYLDNISFNMEVIAYYSEIRFYKTFWYGAYGHILGDTSSREIDLIYKVKLYGSASDNCITTGEISGITTMELKPNCVADYHPYEDNKNKCSSDKYYMDINLLSAPPCNACSTTCTTQCFDSDEGTCSLNYYQGLYWIATQLSNHNSYYTQKVDSINFAFYNSITIPNLSKPSNDEMALEFWVKVFEYIDGGFDSLYITWNQHLRVIIGSTNPDKYYAACFPYIKPGKFDWGTRDSISFTKKGDWAYIRCRADRFHKVFRLNSLDENTYDPEDNNLNLMTSLTIVDNTAKFNYGFSFIRELKLFSSYNFQEWDSGSQNLLPDNYQYLLHYFRNIFDGDDISKVSLYDEVTKQSFPLTPKSDRIGYNYVEDFTYLTICEEGYCYNTTTLKCDICTKPACLIPRNLDGKCLICNDNLYLNQDDNCVSDCSPNFYNDDYFMQCRACDKTCHTCSGKYYNNCLSCVDPYYFVEELHECVENCEALNLGLTPSKEGNLCIVFTAEATIIVPDITVPVDLRNFNSITADVYTASAVDYTTEWSFNLLETYQENLVVNENFDMGLIQGTPFATGADLTSLTVDIDKGFFANGLKYVFYLTVKKENISGGTVGVSEVSIRFVITINDKPQVGALNTVPNEGYISTKFLFTCNECVDDNTDKEKLLYKFTFFPDITDDTNEQLLQDFSPNSEVLHTFTDIPIKDNKFLIKCECMDKFEATNSTTSTIKVYLPPNDSGVNIPIIDSISSIDITGDLTPEQLSNRAEAISTITVDYPKNFILNRTIVTPNEKMLEVSDPVDKFRDEYCNKRGDSYVIDRFLICDCSNYYGQFCQIDGSSYKDVISLYKELYQKVNQAQRVEFDFNLLNTIHLLIKSGSVFLPIEEMGYMTKVIDMIDLFQTKYKNDMLINNNHEILFDIYNSLLDYGFFMVNDLKKKTFIDSNSKLAIGTYDQELIRNATLTEEQSEVMKSYFKKIQNGLDNLLKFYVDQRIEFKSLNKNINIYIALLNENFSFETYFQTEKSIYESFFNVERCISNVMKSTTATSTYKIFMVGKVWKISPYIYNFTLYDNNTSPVISIEFIDYKTGKRVYLTDCGKENEIELYFPVSSYLMSPRINDKRDYVAPENQFKATSGIFNDPVYIDNKGQVFNSTPHERINMYFLPFNFSCKYYKEDKLDIEGVDYNNFTDDNYIQCKSNHLTDFVIEHFDVDGHFHINSRFFYLKHYKLFSFKDNYDFNPAFFISICLISFYIVIIVIYAIAFCLKAKRVDLISYLRESIIKVNLPYRDSYIFSDDLNLPPEIEQKLKSDKKRNPDNYEQNIDINNVDVMVMADEIAKYGRNYEENKIDNKQQDFFRSMEKRGTDVDNKSPFYKNEELEDIKEESEIGRKLKNIHFSKEDRAKKIKRLNKFFQVGFKGTDTIELTKQEITDEDSNDAKPNPPKKIQMKIDNFTGSVTSSTSPTKKLKFFDDENNKPHHAKKKEHNVFQEGYDTYIPTFEKPKVVTETMKFYDKEKEEKPKDNFLSDLTKENKTSQRIPTQYVDTDIKMLRTANSAEINFAEENKKEELPNLVIYLNREKQLLELSNLGISFCSFYRRNLYNRYTLFTTFARWSIFHSRYQRIGNFISQMFIYLLILSILFTADAKMEIMNKKDTTEFGFFVLYCLAALIGGCLFVHIPGYMFYIDIKKIRLLYWDIKEGRGLQLLKDYNTLMGKTFWWNLSGVIIQWIYNVVAIYFAFGFCATYYYQRTTFFIAFVTTVLADLIIVEVLWEFVIAVLYAIRKKGRCILTLCEFLSRMRNVKQVV